MNHSRLLFAALLAWLVCAAPVARAESEQSENWDQEGVTQAAADFAAQLRELVEDPGLEPTQATAVQQRQHHAAVLTMRQVATLAEDLATGLQAGQGYEQTLPIWQQIQRLRQDIIAYAGHSWIAPETRARFQGIQKLLTLLTFYYQSR